MAVKVIEDPNARINARHEAAALQAFDSKHVLRLVALAEDERATYLVTEHAKGGDLLKRMQERACQPMTEDEARRYFRQLVFALDYVHRLGWEHRDVKSRERLVVIRSQGHRSC